ncbi:hypothetical protein [uncultured Gammaproteobacteria bacterium]|jgi:transposase InsO family protein|nr:hypothetical protein [uncultured Gammaproteobacteria bacterium]CAC9970442.1 hypothetical protein [uncultured Gammaproteobacteria bacterium]
MITKMNKAHECYNTRELCQLLKLPRSRYYYQAKVSNKPISDTTNSMIQSMRKISIETGYTYGKRRLKHHLNTKGYQIGIYAVASLMKGANIKAIRPKKRHYYPDTGALHKTTNNLLDHILINKKAIHWVGDITYIKTYQGWSYLASVLDLALRQVVGLCQSILMLN